MLIKTVYRNARKAWRLTIERQIRGYPYIQLLPYLKTFLRKAGTLAYAYYESRFVILGKPRSRLTSPNHTPNPKPHTPHTTHHTPLKIKFLTTHICFAEYVGGQEHSYKFLAQIHPSTTPPIGGECGVPIGNESVIYLRSFVFSFRTRCENLRTMAQY